MQRKTNLKLLCVDGSLIREKSKGEPFTHRVLDANDHLLHYWVKDINYVPFDDVILAMSDPYDIPSHQKAVGESQYSVQALPVIQHFLNNHRAVRCPVSIDTLILSDVFETVGDSTYKALLSQAQGESNLDGLRPLHFDGPSLILQVYLHAHRLATAKPDHELHIDVIHKDEGLINAVTEFYQKHPNLLPKNVILNLGVFYYNSEKGDQYWASDRLSDDGLFIRGTGDTDSTPDWSVRYAVAATTQTFDSGDALAKYHAEGRYQKDNPKLTTIFDKDFDEKAFLAFRQSNIAWLESRMPKNTTTDAQALCRAGLLPETLLAAASEEYEADAVVAEAVGSTQSTTRRSPAPQTQTVRQPSSFGSRSLQTMYSGLDMYTDDEQTRSLERNAFFSYQNNKTTIQQYLITIPKNTGLPNHTGVELITALKEIANMPKWESKGFGFMAYSIPDGIKAIRDFRGREISGLASIFSKKLAGQYHLTRSQMAEDFYGLVVAVADCSINGTAKLQAIKAFCEKHRITAPSIILKQTQRRQSAYQL